MNVSGDKDHKLKRGTFFHNYCAMTATTKSKNYFIQSVSIWCPISAVDSALDF